MTKESKAKKSKSKFDLTAICKQTLMVCGVITALTGAVGGVMDTFGIGGKGSGDAPAPVVSSAAPVGGENRIVIEQRVSGGSGSVHISKSFDLGGIGVAAEAPVAESPIPEQPVMMTMAPEPEMSLSGFVRGIWGWLIGSGIVTIVGIIGLGWWSNRAKECKHEGTGS